ncbi:MAG: NAD(P)(+) transhydrogenase (Re/Si-specific) subunit beta [Pyrinomonadaceae bacterium]|nr:NAD(P)(+) transhydrogenase (Re/Si-specific) subunit beta [Sphingobacteriaceae bacterium]
MDQNLTIQIAYLLASVLFIIGIKMLGKTSTARSGNTLSAVAMLIAVLATLLDKQVLSFTEIFITIIVGSAVGTLIAKRVEMTQMPEMVGLLNGFGGASSVLVATSEYWKYVHTEGFTMDAVTGITVVISIIIGAITFTGSMIAFGKLNGMINGRSITFKGQHLVNALLLVVVILLSTMVVISPNAQIWMGGLLVISLILGVLVVIPIGGADMPVVISLLNSYSGMAACATGFILNNQVLIIAGALVGTSGIILTQIMCKAMNRSLVSVLLGGFGQTTGTSSGSGEEIVVKEVGVEETAMLFDSASSVIIVPGYGMAVAQAQHVVRELTELLEKKNITVKFAIHPVAGRMPGHMNVLLAEANIDYDKLIEMDDINDEFANTDIALIIGANDVVNPAARHNAESPIYGMPILNADKARTVIVCKRSMNAGYAGIENELFGYPNCLMLFGDAKATMAKVVGELKEL